MSEPSLVCPHPTCRKVIVLNQGSDVAPPVCPYCGQLLGEAASDTFSETLAPQVPASPSSDVPGETLPPAAREAASPVTGEETLPPADKQTHPATTGGLVIGPTIPGYKLLGELGRGGMGVVYKAQDVKLNRLVALKMILSGDYTDDADIERFRLEAEAVAKLQHPNIVQVFQIDECDGRPFFSLEFVDGGPLDKKLAGDPLPPREAALLLEQLARAMHYAHQRDIIHRDLKPANILLASGVASAPREGLPPGAHATGLAHLTPKITDFGLAKKLDDQSGRTQSGSIMGTPSYMAPEQALGKATIGPAADIHSLGAILYEFLTGRPPFKGATVLDTLEQVRSQEPVPPRQLQPKVPRDLETICLKCLQKDAGKRYAAAGDLADDVKRFLDGEPIQARPTSRLERAWKWAKRRPGAAAAVVMSVSALVTVAVVMSVSAHQQAELRKAAEAEADKAEQASNYLASIFELAIPSADRDMPTPRQILDEAERRIPEKFKDQPELRDKLLKQIGTVYDKMTADAPLATLLEVRGTVQLQSSRSAKAKAVPQTLLYTGDRLALAPDAHVLLVVLSDLH